MITNIKNIPEKPSFSQKGLEGFKFPSGMMIEVPPQVEYVYSGKMKLLLIMSPPWFKGNETITKKNPSVG